MKKIASLFALAGLLSACGQSVGSSPAGSSDNEQTCQHDCKVHSSSGYSTFPDSSATFMVVPRQISAAEFDSLYSTKFNQEPELIMPGDSRFNKLKERHFPILALDKHTNHELELQGIGYFKDCDQYSFVYEEGPVLRAYMVSGDGVADSACFDVMYNAYSKSCIMAAAEYHKSGFHCSLSFFRYDKENRHMKLLCNYDDVRWRYEGCLLPRDGKQVMTWISADELLCQGAVAPVCERHRDLQTDSVGSPVFYILKLEEKK